MMTKSDPKAAPFTASERDLIRREFFRRFGQEPQLAGGIFLRVWRSGPQEGQPKIPAAIQSMAARGFVEIRQVHKMAARAFFTEAGLTALRTLALDRRALNPEQYGHLRHELGIDDGS